MQKRPDPIIIRPQPGFQEAFLSTPADIAIGGGAAGCGKTFAELLEPTRHIQNKKFRGAFFRRTYAQIKNPGGLLDESQSLYRGHGAKLNETELLWQFPSKSTIKFSHLQHEKDVYSYQGSQFCFIAFDELTHFSETMFWYLLSRNRSVSGIAPYVRATCNPDPDSWVARLIEWYIDQETGLPIPERAGVLRYFIRYNGNMIWGDSKAEVREKAGYIFKQFPEDVNPDDLIKSFTFIPGSIYQNEILRKANPGYLANLLSQDEAIRAQLLEGNWKVRQDNLSLFSFDSINNLWDNVIPSSSGRYITCDAARFGRDLCVILVWSGWEVINIEVIKQSDVHDILKAIEKHRVRFGVAKSNTLIDQDGVGASAVRMGGYKGFSGGELPRKVQGLKENYKNLKTQCYYYLAEQKVNLNDIKINVTDGNCMVDGIWTTKVKVGGKVSDIKELIRDDLRAIKRDKVDMEGKICINPKEEQKVILGRSPDFGDSLMMRALFDFMPKSQWL